MKSLAVAVFVVVALALPALGSAAPPAAVELDGLSSTPPAGWEEKPAAGMRKKQWTLKSAKGDTLPAELVIFHFGKGQGGSAEDNIKRWTGMFENATPKTSTETISGVKTTMVELGGTYLYRARPMDPGPAERREKHLLIGVVFESPGGPYYMRLVGPEATVVRHRAAFQAWLRGFKKR